MDKPTAFVNKVDLMVDEVMRFPELKKLLLLLSQSPKFRRLRKLVRAIGRPRLISPDPGDTVPTSSSVTVTFSAGSPTATYTVNIINSSGAIIHTCTGVSIDPITLEGTCTVPAGTLGDGENFTVEVVTNGTTFTTIGWFMTAVAI